MTTLEKIKQALRISHSKLDDDIQATIDAGLADLQVAGVKFKGEEDPLIYNAIALWCRAHHTDDADKAAKWFERYNALKSCLMMAEGYGWEADGDE